MIAPSVLSPLRNALAFGSIVSLMPTNGSISWSPLLPGPGCRGAIFRACCRADRSLGFVPGGNQDRVVMVLYSGPVVLSELGCRY